MMSRPRNITPRPYVYCEKRQQRSDSEMQEVEENVEKLKDKVKGWPKPLQDVYYDYERKVDEDNEWIRMCKTFLKLKDIRLPPKYTDLLQECNYYLPPNMTFYQPENASPKSFPYQPESVRVNQNMEISKNGSIMCYSVCVCIIAMLICAVLLYINKQDVPEFNSSKIATWTQNIKYLQEKFPSQKESIWYRIASGVKTIVTEKPTKPGVLLLLHDDKKTSSCLAQKIGKEAVKLLSDTQLTQEPILIKGEDLKSNKSLAKDYGEFSETYKHEIQKKHVMIILDLQEIPALLAQAFHVLCDVENPLIDNAAFLFTMQVDMSDKRQQNSATAIAEKKLHELWKGTLDTDIREPLITRITDAVVSVKMETHLPC